MDLAAEYAELARASTLVHDIGQELVKAKATAQSQVDSLVGAGWVGVAADAYSEAWQEWSRAADEVMGALATESELLDRTRAALESSDDGVDSRMTALHQRLGGA